MSVQFTILPNEKDLFVRAAEGDQTAFTNIFDHYSPRLFAFILKITKSQSAAEDITQEVFLKLWTNREKLPDIKSYSSYIFTMAFNYTVNYIKRNIWEAGKLRIIENNGITHSNITEEIIDFNESNLLVQQAVQQLPPQKKIIYKLNREQGLTLEQIAGQMNLSRNTVRNHLAEAINFIRTYIKQQTISVIVLILSNNRLH
ncbi:RNA polymerase sigma-70 factor [Niastella caeni]|uniref:RNA polymerase sigma-70 factor n=1 Tax=Niastella caeni TaxID=2569763 RepID=A0A4S8HKN9_9BACT|nr:RNA polymerase sigma-70 factor [Niastella caeni]THU35850.1 RNA polymerase sigma-70 factor [Niastella caeni]